jgi:hypothetical protein
MLPKFMVFNSGFGSSQILINLNLVCSVELTSLGQVEFLMSDGSKIRVSELWIDVKNKLYPGG